jgi:hypothetical protein
MENKTANELLREAAELRKKQKADLERVTNELMTQKNLSEALAREEAKKLDLYKAQATELKYIVEQHNEIKADTKETIQSYITQEKGLKSLTGLNASLVERERVRLEIMSNARNLDKGKQQIFESIASLQNDLLQTSAEDLIQKAEIERQLDEHYESLEGVRGIHAHIRKNLMEQRDIARGVSNLTENQQAFLNKQIGVYETIKDTIGGVFDTAQLLTSGFKGFLVVSLAGAAKLANKLGEVNEKLGGIRNLSTTAISFFDDNAVSNLESLSKEFGGINNVSSQIQISTSLISKNMGISGDEAATLIGAFSRINGNTKDIALDMIKTTQQFAKQNGLIPAKLLGDLAKNTELFAKYAKDGGDNIIRAAGFAQKLGIELSDIEKIQSSLLDFETSIANELELSAMLGRNINLDRARGLFFAGKIEEATKETLNVIGGIEAFNAMDPISKQKTADLLGVQVSQLQQMLDQTTKVATSGELIREKFSKSGEAVDTFLNNYLGFTLNSLSSMLIVVGQMGIGFQQIGKLMKFLRIDAAFSAMWMGIKRGYQATILALSQRELISEKAKLGIQRLSSFFSLASLKNKIMELGIVKKLIGALTVKKRVESTPGPALARDGVSSMVGGMTGLLRGAAAMLIIAASIFVLGKALQQFSDVNWSAVLSGLIVMGIFVGIAYLLGQGFAVLGLGVLILLGIAASMYLVAASFDLFASAIVKLTPTIKELAEVGITKLAGAAGGIALLAGSFYLLAASLAAVAVAGLAALPALTAVAGFSVIAGVAAGIGSGISNVISGNDKDNTMVELLNEIRGLRRELIDGKIAVYMDGEKVTAQVSRTVDRIGRNSYSI